MNIYKKRIIDMMRYKSHILSKDDVVYFTPADEAAIKSWKISDCEAFITNLYAENYNTAWDIALCPFCYHYGFENYYETACCKCSYGKRHLICSDRSSTYKKIIKAHGDNCLWNIVSHKQRN